MKKIILFLLLTATVSFLRAQENPVVEQQIENLTEVTEGETEDDSYLQSLQHYLKNKLNLNTASEADLKEFPFISQIQISNLLNYRRLFGKLLSIYELQAVPGWDLYLIQRMLPFVTAADPVSLSQDLGKRFTAGEHSILMRATYVLEKSEGFKRKDDPTATSFYPGSRERALFRYKYVYKNLLQFGITGEKDAGEQWFKGAQKNGFDFYSAHLFARNIGIIKAVALGDYTVNLGQGLIHWQALAFRKSPDILNIKRQATVLRPYNSTSEYLFSRGAAITLEKNGFQVTGFASFRQVDGSIQSDTSFYSEDYFSSLLTSGLHRTLTEQEKKNQVQMNTFGGNISYNTARLHLGLNGVQHNFSKPFSRDAAPYNNYTFKGTQLTNYSFDWGYTLRNIHWYGEAAMHNNKYFGLISGMLMSIDPKVDMSLVYRNLQAGYQSIFGNAYTESTYPTNEKGLYTGISIKPTAKWRLDAYADVFRFPWLRYRVDAPSGGKDFLVQLTHKPNKQLEIYTRYRLETKSLNFNPDDELVMPDVRPVPRKNWRVQIQYKVSPTITLRNRLDAMWYDEDGPLQSRGFLCFFDVFYKPMMKPISANMRLQYFETDNFDSRIYAYESDVLYGFSIPAFYDKGYKYYANVNYDLSKKLSLWLRWAQLIYKDKTAVGSGLDAINGNHRTEVKVQILWKF